MKYIGVLCALLFSLVAFGPQAQAQPQSPNTAPSMPPSEPKYKKILCPSGQYLHPGRHDWRPSSKRWLWLKQECRNKPSYWREGCSWQKGYWQPKGQGARYHYGAVKCTTQKAPAPKKAEKKVSPLVETPKKKAETKVMPILAVFDIEVVNLKSTRTFRASLSDFVAMRMTETRAYEVLPRSQLKKRLVQSKKETYKECYDQACQIEIGKELAAEKTLSTKISKMGRRCMITMGVYDLRKATAEKAATQMGECTEDDLIDSMEKAIAKLTKAN